MTDKHTPGPWAARTGRANTTVYAGPAYAVALGCRAADARLIAAAPELLEACRAVVDRWERGDLAEAARMCEAAIELATEDLQA